MHLRSAKAIAVIRTVKTDGAPLIRTNERTNRRTGRQRDGHGALRVVEDEDEEPQLQSR